MRTNARIWTHADEADRLADLVLRRVCYLPAGATTDELLAKIRAELAAIKRLANDKAGGA